MKATLVLYTYFFKESFSEIKNNLNIFGIYLVGLLTVALVNNFVDQTYLINNTNLRLISKILFLLIPILILSKILYVMRIRISGLGEYKSVLSNYLIYNIFYSMFVMFGLLIYIIPSFTLHWWLNSNNVFFWLLFLLLPCLYIIIFYSLTPFVAVFEDDRSIDFFKRSALLTKRNLLLVVINHFFAWLPNFFMLLINLISNNPTKYTLLVVMSLPEAIFQLIIIITTTKIYFYLLNLEEVDAK